MRLGELRELRRREEAGRGPRTLLGQKPTSATAPASTPRGPAERSAPHAAHQKMPVSGPKVQGRADSAAPGGRTSRERLRACRASGRAQARAGDRRAHACSWSSAFRCWGCGRLRREGLRGDRARAGSGACAAGGNGDAAEGSSLGDELPEVRTDAREEGVERLLPSAMARRAASHGGQLGRGRDVGQAGNERAAGLGRDDGPLDRST